MTEVVIYTSAVCPWCDRAKQLLASKHVTWQEIRVDTDPALRAQMEQRSGKRTIPQIFINGQSVGGFDDLSALNRSGRLDTLLHTDRET